VVIVVLIATPMAYVMAWHRTRLAKAATGWVVVSQAFPFVLVIIPLFLVLKNLRLINSVPGLIMVYVVWALPFALWMLVGYVRAVPVEMEEAAAVDGAGKVRTLVSIPMTARRVRRSAAVARTPFPASSAASTRWFRSGSPAGSRSCSGRRRVSTGRCCLRPPGRTGSLRGVEAATDFLVTHGHLWSCISNILVL
jgi:hypothetical protein